MIVELNGTLGGEETGVVRLKVVPARATGDEIVATEEWLRLLRLSPLYVAVTNAVPAGMVKGIFKGIGNGPGCRV